MYLSMYGVSSRQLEWTVHSGGWVSEILGVGKHRLVWERMQEGWPSHSGVFVENIWSKSCILVQFRLENVPLDHKLGVGWHPWSCGSAVIDSAWHVYYTVELCLIRVVYTVELCLIRVVSTSWNSRWSQTCILSALRALSLYLYRYARFSDFYMLLFVV